MAHQHGAMTDEYDVIVIGAGPVGENAAQYAVTASTGRPWFQPKMARGITTPITAWVT